MLMVQCALKRGYKCLYVVPFVSIALEKAQALQMYSRLGFRIAHAASNYKVENFQFGVHASRVRAP